MVEAAALVLALGAAPEPEPPPPATPSPTPTATGPAGTPPRRMAHGWRHDRVQVVHADGADLADGFDADCSNSDSPACPPLIEGQTPERVLATDGCSDGPDLYPPSLAACGDLCLDFGALWGFVGNSGGARAAPGLCGSAIATTVTIPERVDVFARDLAPAAQRDCALEHADCAGVEEVAPGHAPRGLLGADSCAEAGDSVLVRRVLVERCRVARSWCRINGGADCRRLLGGDTGNARRSTHHTQGEAA